MMEIREGDKIIDLIGERIDYIIKRLDEHGKQLDGIVPKVEEIHEKLHGNGREGLVEEFTTLKTCFGEHCKDEEKKEGRSWDIKLLIIGNIVLLFFGAFKLLAK